MRLAYVVLCASVWLGIPARAGAGPGLVVCQINADDSGASVPARLTTPLSDPSVRELAELGEARVVEGREAEHYVAFTFDDGPKHTTTPRVLDALDQYDVPAMFFVVGWRFDGKGKVARRHADLLAEILRRGHHIGNHTYRHKNLAQIRPEVMRSEIDRNTEALEKHLGYTPHAFRPPYGAMTEKAREHVRDQGLTEVRWSIDTNDFRPELARTLRARTVKKILDRQGGVVLMHDTKEVTAKNIAGILDDLERENCRRLDAGERPIVPVSLHYFIVNQDGTPRPVPAEVEARTRQYTERLPARCQARMEKRTRGQARTHASPRAPARR